VLGNDRPVLLLLRRIRPSGARFSARFRCSDHSERRRTIGTLSKQPQYFHSWLKLLSSRSIGMTCATSRTEIAVRILPIARRNSETSK
jgi:hypothetical protein